MEGDRGEPARCPIDRPAPLPRPRYTPAPGEHPASDHETGRTRHWEPGDAADQRPFGPHESDGPGVSAQTPTHDRQRLVVVLIAEAGDAPAKELVLVGCLEPLIV